MTTYNTGNPVGSAAPKDLYDNSENLDELVNSPTKETHPDRLGVTRKTWHGMETEFDADQSQREADFQQFLVNSGYVGTGVGGAYEDYDLDGPLTINALNEIFTKDGEFYRAKASLSLPYTTTGTWVGDDEARFVSVGDAALRQELAADGGAFLVQDAVASVANVTELRALTGLADGQRVSVTSYRAGWAPSARGPIGGGEFTWDASSTEAVDNVSVFQLDAGGTGRFIRHVGESVDIADGGAVLDGVTDDSGAIIAAAAYAKSKGIILTGSGVCFIDSEITLREQEVDFSSLDVKLGASGTLTVGGDSAAPVTAPQHYFRITRNGGVTALPDIKVVGSKSFRLTVERANYMLLYADTDNATDTSIAYCTFNVGKIEKVELNTNPSPVGSTIQWINENTFNMKSVNELIVDGTYGHNHNIFYAGTYEAALGQITFNRGNSNQIFAARLESGAPITFADGTWGNAIIHSWYSNKRSAYQVGGFPVSVTDNGVGNMVLSSSSYLMRNADILPLTPLTVRSFDDVNQPRTSLRGVRIAPGVDSLIVQNDNVVLADSGLIPVSRSHGFQCIAPTNVFRYRVYLYDADGVPITGINTGSNPGYLVVSGNMSASSDDFYGNTVNVQNTDFVVAHDDVAYIRVEMRSGPGASGTPIEYMLLRSMTPHIQEQAGAYSSIMASRDPATDAIPTMGWAEPGETVQNLSAAGTRYLCTFSDRDILGAAVAGTDTTITLDSAVSAAVGDVVGIRLDDGGTHWTSVSVVNSTTSYDITDAMPSAAAAGKAVQFIRWV